MNPAARPAGGGGGGGPSRFQSRYGGGGPSRAQTVFDPHEESAGLLDDDEGDEGRELEPGLSLGGAQDGSGSANGVRKMRDDPSDCLCTRADDVSSLRSDAFQATASLSSKGSVRSVKTPPTGLPRTIPFQRSSDSTATLKLYLVTAVSDFLYSALQIRRRRRVRSRPTSFAIRSTTLRHSCLSSYTSSSNSSSIFTSYWLHCRSSSRLSRSVRFASSLTLPTVAELDLLLIERP